MDAKSKANFINSVASGQKIPCPVCGKLNDPDSAFCGYCGSDMKAASSKNTSDTISSSDTSNAGSTVPAFTQVAPQAAPKAAESPAPSREAPVKTVKYVEPESVFADGLPSWDIVPPQVVVRRRS